jgi:hypothetical protein
MNQANVDPYRTPADAANDDATGLPKRCMVMGILASALSWVPVIGIVFGIIAITRYKRFSHAFVASGHRLPSRGMAIAGLICGISGLALSVIFLIYWSVALLVLARF